MEERLIVREARMEESTRRPTFENLYRAHVGEARRVAYLCVGDLAHAEDIVQDAFIRVLGRFGDLRKPSAFKTYLMQTVISLSKNHFRRRSVERNHPHIAPEPVGAPTEPDDELLNALRRLPHRQRTAVVLRYCQDLSENDTAEILQTSTKAVQSLVRRGLATLKKEVER